jgi:hypothetical protein
MSSDTACNLALKDEARKVKLEAEQHHGLAARQRAARKALSYSDPLGMVHIHVELEPHIGAPIVARAEAEAQRLSRKAKTDTRKGSETSGDPIEPFERHLADAYAALLSVGSGRGRAKRPELVVLVSHEVAQRGWRDVRRDEVCKIPGVGPIAPQIAKEISSDAFLNGVFFDGTTLRQARRSSRTTFRSPKPAELAVGPLRDGPV